MAGIKVRNENINVGVFARPIFPLFRAVFLSGASLCKSAFMFAYFIIVSFFCVYFIFG